MSGTTRRPLDGHHLLWPVGIVVVGASAAMVADNPFTTYGGLGPWWRWGEAAAAAALIAAGIVTAGGRRRLGLATVATGLLWLAPEWAGWTAGPDWVPPVAAASSALLAAAAILAVAAGGELWTPLLTRTVVAAAALSAGARVLLLDPFADPRCWRRCSRSPLAVSGTDGIGRIADRAGTVGLALIAVTALATMVWRGRRARTPAAGSAVLGAAALLLGVVGPAWLRLSVAEDPRAGGFTVAFVTATAGALVLAGTVAIEQWREWRLASALFKLVEDVRAAPPGSLEAALADTFGDPSLRLLCWSTTQDEYVDADGQACAPSPGVGQSVTAIVRRGLPVAVLVHGDAIDGNRIQRAIGPAVRLSLENEQLRASTSAELAALKASRARIVEQADAERRRLERNLHDGAQQRVVGMALLLRTIRPRLAGQPGSTGGALLARAEALVAATLDDLRRLATGIHPAVLADGGLRAAVPDLAETSTDLAVRIDSLPAGRQSAGVEGTAYLVVAEAVADARRRAATTLSVAAGDHDGMLVVELVDDAPPGADGHTVSELDDRVGALDGTLTVAPAGAAGTRVRLELPCGW